MQTFKSFSESEGSYKRCSDLIQQIYQLQYNVQKYAPYCVCTQLEWLTWQDKWLNYVVSFCGECSLQLSHVGASTCASVS